MKRPTCKIASCTDKKPTGSCRRYHEGFEAGREQGKREMDEQVSVVLARGRELERAAVVDRLRDSRPHPYCCDACARRYAVLNAAADEIEAGEHVAKAGGGK